MWAYRSTYDIRDRRMTILYRPSGWRSGRLFPNSIIHMRVDAIGVYRRESRVSYRIDSSRNCHDCKSILPVRKVTVRTYLAWSRGNESNYSTQIIWSTVSVRLRKAAGNLIVTKLAENDEVLSERAGIAERSETPMHTRSNMRKQPPMIKCARVIWTSQTRIGILAVTVCNLIQLKDTQDYWILIVRSRFRTPGLIGIWGCGTLLGRIDSLRSTGTPADVLIISIIMSQVPW